MKSVSFRERKLAAVSQALMDPPPTNDYEKNQALMAAALALVTAHCGFRDGQSGRPPCPRPDLDQVRAAKIISLLDAWDKEDQ
jgi:hypothetical protein